MTNPSIAARIETALAGASPDSALYELAKVLQDEGMSQEEIYRWFDQGASSTSTMRTRRSTTRS